MSRKWIIFVYVYKIHMSLLPYIISKSVQDRTPDAKYYSCFLGIYLNCKKVCPGWPGLWYFSSCGRLARLFSCRTTLFLVTREVISAISQPLRHDAQVFSLSKYLERGTRLWHATAVSTESVNIPLSTNERHLLAILCRMIYSFSGVFNT